MILRVYAVDDGVICHDNIEIVVGAAGHVVEQTDDLRRTQSCSIDEHAHGESSNLLTVLYPRPRFAELPADPSPGVNHRPRAKLST